MVFMSIVVTLFILLYIFTLHKYKLAKVKGIRYKGLKPIHVIVGFVVTLVLATVFHDSNIIYKGERLLGTYQSVENKNERLEIYKFSPNYHVILIKQKTIDPTNSNSYKSGSYNSKNDIIELDQFSYQYKYDGKNLELIDNEHNIKKYEKIGEENVKLDKVANSRIKDNPEDYKRIDKQLKINAKYQIYYNDDSWET